MLLGFQTIWMEKWTKFQDPWHSKNSCAQSVKDSFDTSVPFAKSGRAVQFWSK